MYIANRVHTSILDAVIDRAERYHMVSATRVLEDQAYAQFYWSRSYAGDFVMLNNDAHELKRPVSIGRMVDAAELVNPNEILLPDFPGSAERTIEAAERALAFYLQNTEYREFMAVPHGENEKEWLACAERLTNLPYVVSLGVAESDAQHFNGNRIRMVHELTKYQRPIHLLGMSFDFVDIQSRWIRENVRGCDTGKIVNAALAGVQLRVGGEFIPSSDYGGARIKNVSEAYNSIMYWRGYAGVYQREGVTKP